MTKTKVKPRQYKQVLGLERESLALQMRSKYEDGATIRGLAKFHGKSYGFVHRLLSEAGTMLRKRGGARGAK